MRNHEVTTKQRLLNSQGAVNEPGWSRQLLQEYHREDITASKFRIKEWDYYLVTNDDYALAFTLSDLAYAGLISVSFIRLSTKEQTTETILTPFPLGKLKLPKSSLDGDVCFKNERLHLTYINNHGQREIHCHFKNFLNQDDLKCFFKLSETQPDSLVIATPWTKNRFYYNQKINCIRVEGNVKLGDEKEIEFQPENSFATLDWGRGVWTYDNHWYWGTGNGVVARKLFGFNLGYGFGNTEAATENIYYYDGRSYKLDDVDFIYQKENLLAPWKITSHDGRLEFDFEPILDRQALHNYFVIVSDQHQIFGKISGFVLLEEGKKLEIDNVIGSFEIIHNKY